MNCPSCNASTRIASSKLESEVGSTDVYSVMIMVCVNNSINPPCPMYEPNLESPTRVIETIRNKVN